MIEARFNPLNPPELKYIHHARSATYFGKIESPLIVTWLKKKLGMPTNQIENT
jgi:hypothetical protein